MPAKYKNVISVDGQCFLLLIPIVLFVPLRWIGGWVFAALIHELGHLLVLRLLQVKILAIKISIFGASISTEPMPPVKEALCTLAGPAAGLSILWISHIVPYAALSGLLQSIYNLIPVYPLDGGRALRCILSALLQQRVAADVSNMITGVVLFALLLFGIVTSLKYSLGLTPLLFPLMPILFTVRKNSLHCRQKNSTIRKRKYSKGNYV